MFIFVSKEQADDIFFLGLYSTSTSDSVQDLEICDDQNVPVITTLIMCWS